MMYRTTQTARLRAGLLVTTMLAAFATTATPARADMNDGPLDNSGQLPLPSGQYITPTAATGAVFRPLNPGLADNPTYNAGQAINTALSPDGKTLLIVTSGYNRLSDTSGQQSAADSNEYVFVFDVSGANKAAPMQKQVLKVPDTYIGLAWDPSSTKFYVSGGIDDKIYIYSGSSASGWTSAGNIPLNHPNFGAAFAGTPFAQLGAFLGNGIGFQESASVAGLGVSSDGSVLVATNIYNESISIIDTSTNTVRAEYDLRPYHTSSQTGVAGGEAPFDVAVKGNTTAYVSSLRDREIVVVNIAGASPSLITRIPVSGSPNSVLLNPDQSRLYVAEDNSDRVAVIDTTTNTVVQEIDTIAPPHLLTTAERYTGAAPNGLALSPDGQTLYVTNGGSNSVAVIPVGGGEPYAVSGLIPTGWYPHSVSVSADGTELYVVNGKSDPGHNPSYQTSSANQYILQLEAAGLLAMPAPSSTDLASLTTQVAANNSYSVPPNPADTAMMSALHQRIQHIIYIVKENRTFDQVLGDLGNGSNGNPTMTMYGKRITPNFHRLAGNFVTLDNFFCSGEVSGNGWAWSTEGRESDFGTKTIPMNYANRGSSDDAEGLNRDLNVGLTYGPRQASYPQIPGAGSLYNVIASALPGGPANLLPGTANDFATDGPSGTPIQTGYLWDAVLRANLTVRNYGYFIDLTRYVIPTSLGGLPPVQNPAAINLQVAYPSNPTLAPYTDPYFRGFDNAFPDVWREQEWERDFATYDPSSPTYAGKPLPSLSLVRFMHDHTGNFDTAVGGFNTLETQQADNDFAVGRLVQRLANSPYAGNTLVFVLEDDAQDGPDHMDAHRSTAYVVGPYVKHNAIVSTRYSTVNMIRTMEDILGIDHLNLNDTYQRPMTDLFDLNQPNWTYSAVASTVLRTTLAALPGSGIRYAEGPDVQPIHDAAYWAAQTAGFDWSGEDRVPAGLYNRIQWAGMMGGRPYPTVRDGIVRRTTTTASNGEIHGDNQ